MTPSPRHVASRIVALAALAIGVLGCCEMDGRPPIPVFCRDMPTEMPEFALVAHMQPDTLPPPTRVTDAAPDGDSVLASCFAGDRTVDLAGVLSLADGGNPTIALGEEIVQANLAEQTLARALLFPTLNVGATLSVHRGAYMNGTGSIVDVNRQSLYLGAGADVRGAGPIGVPGVRIIGNLGEAYYAPRIAEQRVASSRFDAVALRNRVLLDVARAYLALTSAEARLLAYRQSQSETGEVARITANFARAGQGRDSDAERAETDRLLLEADAVEAENDIVAWSAELSRLTRSDPTLRLRPPPGTPPIFRLVDERTPLDGLIGAALAQRPELAARAAEVAMNESRFRQERVRPLLPTISIGYSAGDMGGGSNQVPYRFGHFGGRSDVDVMAVWTLQNFGLGNRADQNAARAQIGQAEALRSAAIDGVRREVAEALVKANAERTKMTIAQRRAGTAQQAFRQDLQRTKNVEGRPIETLTSLRALSTARQEFVEAMSRFSQSQFELYVAIGGVPYAPMPAENR
jgi:outer membrane protein TolC